MLAILIDNKFHNGRFKSYNDFARDMRVEFGKDISSKEITARWNKNTDTFYSNIVVDPKLGVVMGENFKEKFGEKAEEEFDFYHESLTAKITQVNQSVDSIISNEDQIRAQRDVLTNALLMHRGWFIINMTRKWKGKHFNLATGQYEEGHYKSVYKSLKKLVKNGISKKELSESLEEHEIRNLVRVGVDALGIALLIGLTNAMMEGDDDDDSYLEDLAQLVAMRTTNETQSQHIIGTLGTTKDIYSEPLVQRRLLSDVIYGIPAVMNLSDDEKAAAKFWRQNLYGRRTYQLSDLESQLNSYMHFNKGTLWWITEAQKDKAKAD